MTAPRPVDLSCSFELTRSIDCTLWAGLRPRQEELDALAALQPAHAPLMREIAALVAAGNVSAAYRRFLGQ